MPFLSPNFYVSDNYAKMMTIIKTEHMKCYTFLCGYSDVVLVSAFHHLQQISDADAFTSTHKWQLGRPKLS